MNYETPAAFRMGLEQRLRTKSNESGISIDRLRRRVIFERFVTRLQQSEPGQWVLKGGMAPSQLPELPANWRRSYEELAGELGLGTLSYEDAVGIAAEIWRRSNQRA